MKRNVILLDGPHAGETIQVDPDVVRYHVEIPDDEKEPALYMLWPHLDEWFEGRVPAVVGKIEKVGATQAYSDVRALPYAAELVLRRMVEQSGRHPDAEIRIRVGKGIVSAMSLGVKPLGAES